MNQSPTPASRQPIFNIPPITYALLIVNIGVHVIRLLLPESADDAFVRIFAFVPTRYTISHFGWSALLDPISYQFLHANWTHLVVNMLALLAFGSGVERKIGGWRMLVLAMASGVLAAGAHWAVYPSSGQPVIGASGAISGLFGGVLRMQTRAGAGGGASLWALVALWIVVTVIGGQVEMPGEPGAPIAWVAHLGGFVAGLVIFGLVDRPRDSHPV